MAKVNPKNVRILRKYLHWLEGPSRKTKKTATQIAAAISLFEASTGGKDFASFHFEDARKFRRDLEKAKHERTGKPLALSTIRSRLNAVKEFFIWLQREAGYKRLNPNDFDYFNLSRNQERVATASGAKPVPTLEQVRHVIENSPHETIVEQRDRALIAFTLLTGMRDAAIASLPLGNVTLTRQEVFQDARVVKTKNSKTMTTYFFPVGEDIVEIVTDWAERLKMELLFADTDPLFPQTETRPQDGAFAATGVTKEYWKDASAIRRIFRERFEAVGLTYFQPHSLRKTLMHYAYELDLSARELKAWSQNLGHENLMTSFTSYGKLDTPEVGDVIMKISTDEPGNTAPPPETLAWMQALLKKAG